MRRTDHARLYAMMHFSNFAFILGIIVMNVIFSAHASPQTVPTLSVTAQGINPQGFIEPKHAFCIPSSSDHQSPGENINIGLKWASGPSGTKSYAILAVDNDVPKDFSPANKEGQMIPASAERRPFYHWVLLDIPFSRTQIEAGLDSNSTDIKPIGATAYGVRGINDYSTESETRGGYDGPCPPWNDEKIHQYHFKVYALSADNLGGTGRLTGPQALELITPYILATGTAIGHYSMTPIK